MNIAAFLTQASEHAAQIDRIFILLVAISIVIMVLVVALVIVFGIRYRRGSKARRGRLPNWIQHELELGWTSATLFLFLFLFWWAASSQLSALSPPANAIEVHVVAKQWMWKIEQPSGIREINELHVPEGKAVRLVMTSEDVIHSMFLPSLRIKQDVLPGRYTYLWFTANKTGTYALMCAEFCGTEHSRMLGRIVIMPQADYARWSASPNEGDNLASAGRDTFVRLGCAGCHSPASTVHAPDLHGLFGRTVVLDGGRRVTADEAYIRDSILMPSRDVAAGYPNLMPSFHGIATEEDLVKLVAYIKSLGPAGASR
jgi:cytochrome c oxidase subunit 2